MVEAEISQDRVETLEAQLADRDQLVAALTERLEQAAEQLDRLHRTGADRGVRSGILGIPPELIQQQQKLVEDLQQAVQQWEDMQPGAFFGRLEGQLSQIHDLVRNSGGGGSGNGHNPNDAAFARNDSRVEASPGRRNPSDSPRSVLEFMKASFEAAHPDTEASPPANADVPPPVAGPPAVLNIDLPALHDPPEPIDSPNATREELVQACETRDSYVVYLLQRLRQIESMGHIPNSWAGLENLPDQLRTRLEALEKRLEETLRLAEVENSLQRAKLAREEVRIRVIDEQLQKDLKRAKQDAGMPGDNDGGKDEQSGSRWKRMLGRRGENG